MDQARPQPIQSAPRPRVRRLVGLSSSDPIRWRPSAPTPYRSKTPAKGTTQKGLTNRGPLQKGGLRRGTRRAHRQWPMVGFALLSPPYELGQYDGFAFSKAAF